MYLKMLLQSRQWGYTSKIFWSQIASLAKESELCTFLACSMGKISHIFNYFIFINEVRSWGWERKNWVGVNWKKFICFVSLPSLLQPYLIHVSIQSHHKWLCKLHLAKGHLSKWWVGARIKCVCSALWPVCSELKE